MPTVRLALIVLLVAGCSARQPPPPVVAAVGLPPVDVSALVRHGCFHCLERALGAAQGPQVFEVAALLTLRAKELGLPHVGYRTRAAAAAPAEPAYAVYLEVIDAIPADALSGERYRQESGDAASATRVGRLSVPVLSPLNQRAVAWREVIRIGPGSELFRQYLDVTLSCALASRRGEAGESVGATRTDAPLLVYRHGLCGNPVPLKALRERDAEFVDADFALAREALSGRPADLDEALRYIESAHAAFPESLAIATALGSVREEREEWVGALVAYDRVLAQAPEHRDALLGRTTSLSRLRRHDEAIASASRMIELGAWFIGEAHYWRAWNAFSVQRYAEARVDADRAKSLMVNAAVFLLSGLIDWNEGRLPGAETEFEEALKMDFGRCDAAHYLGRVRIQRGKVPEALAALQQAIQCFDLSIALRQKLMADAQAGPGSEAARARAAAGHARAIADATKDRDECVGLVGMLERRGTR